jgi:hypothetical protein
MGIMEEGGGGARGYAQVAFTARVVVDLDLLEKFH